MPLLVFFRDKLDGARLTRDNLMRREISRLLTMTVSSSPRKTRSEDPWSALALTS